MTMMILLAKGRSNDITTAPLPALLESIRLLEILCFS